MASNAEKAAEIFKGYIGKEDEPGEWFTVDQDRINKFADCTIDHQFIHVDPEQLGAAVAVQGDDRARLPDAVDAHAPRGLGEGAVPGGLLGHHDGRELRLREGALRRAR